MRSIGGYRFTTPESLTEATPPKDVGGVYALLSKETPRGGGAVEYIGSTTDLQGRLNWGHEIAKKLANKHGKDKVLVAWYPIRSIKKAQQIEEKLIKQFGTRVVNSNKKAK